MLRLAALLASCALATSLAGGPAWGLADLDPLDPESCKHPDGFVVVAKDWVISLDSAAREGRITDQQFTDLAVWWTAMENWLIETNKVRETCEALIQARQVHGF